MNTQDINTDTNIIITHNAPLTLPRKPQLGDVQQFDSSDATITTGLTAKGLDESRSALVDGGLGSFSGAPSPATSPSAEKNISVPPSTHELVGTVIPTQPGEGVQWTDGLEVGYVLIHNTGHAFAFHSAAIAQEAMDTNHGEAKWANPAVPVLVAGVEWRPVQLIDGMPFLDEPELMPGRDDVASGTYTGGV